MEKFVENPELDDLAVTRGLGHRAYVALLLQQAFVNSRWPGTGLIDYCFFHSQAKEVGETLLESFGTRQSYLPLAQPPVHLTKTCRTKDYRGYPMVQA